MKTLAELKQTYHLPLPDLLFRAAEVHRAHHDINDIQRCALLSIKTGGCPEDCGYCAQSARYQTGVPGTPLMSLDEVRKRAQKAKELGASRFCMGTAWREPRDGPQFDRVLDMVRVVRALGMEACVTLGMLTENQARRLAEAGLTAYNHNLDTSRRHYSKIISTRTYDDRLNTLWAVQEAGIAVCCGGILGMGETEEDRLMLLAELARLQPPPESIPINCLTPIAGTPLQDAPPVDAIELVRLIATARIAFPRARVRLSAGRDKMSRELQVLCFLAGANSIFFGEKLLTAPNPSADEDAELFRAMGLGESARAQERGSALGAPALLRSRAPSQPLPDRWKDSLDELRELGRYRRLSLPRGIDFSSNDYLGFGREEKDLDAFFSSGLASRLLRGQHTVWEEVESNLARWHNAEAALMFTSGYVANEGLLSAVIEPGDFVASDEFNHASIIDGLRLSKAERFIFRHNELEHLESGLSHAARRRSRKQQFFVVTESLFGMDGDRAPLQDLVEICAKYEAHVIVDEAHATGCFGPAGAGCVDEAGLRSQVLATVHTGGKALGVAGAYVCGSRQLRELLINRCRHFIFTTALSPALGVCWCQAMMQVRKADERRRRLHESAALFRAELGRRNLAAKGQHYIVRLILGDDASATEAARRLQEAGWDIPAIRPPSVPPGTARLRISIHADHDRATVIAAARAVAEVFQQHNQSANMGARSASEEVSR
jgi:biotin synthase/8-amino-7-oxononanoate synthase